ncbi:2-amino-4-hydroxy-6-hydroxymethyldihydropteridine diphosphokinase [Phaeovulum sp.]|uniref:2-amino-4-hydroxy-6- hydroxymethyldihydropteridine diphosphokinase n=1 Tax=Phaeovulum sp. TaxID=2934796 RepID=UPI003566E322
MALGGNLAGPSGDVAATLIAALQSLAAQGFEIAAVSRFYATPAHPPGSGPNYVNACARLHANRSPLDVLAGLHSVEAAFGRVRGARWAARGLDLDLLAVGQTILPDAETEAAWRALTPDEQLIRTPQTLILPHPRMAERAFVLIPLAEIAPQWHHPSLGKTVKELVAALPEAEKAAIHPLSGRVGGESPLVITALTP